MQLVRDVFTGRSRLLSANVHPQYRLTINEMQTMRDCIEGSPTIKRYTYDYLPHPSQIDKDSDEAKARYAQYLAGAEFDNYPDETRRSLLGKMRIDNSTTEIPEQLQYMVEDFDGDGMDMTGAMEYAANNVMQMKWHVLVSDYQGLSDIDLESISVADLEQLDPRATVKQYPRENVVNWHFDRVNGVMQLRFIMLLERGWEFDENDYFHIEIESYLILALDRNGEYYQEKLVYKGDGKGFERSERSYVEVDGQRLNWIPAVIVADEKLDQNRLPVQMGYLYPICEATLNRYRVSADYKETQRNLAPTTYTQGWSDGDMDTFMQANGGRSYVATGPGAVNNMPDGVTVDVVSAATEMEDFHWYFTNNEEKIRQLGGSVKSDAMNTATEAEIDAANQNALLETIASNIEGAFKRAVSYCAMFEGLWSPDEVNNRLDDIQIKLPRDFATPKLTVDEVNQILNMYLQGLRTRDQAVKQLAAGGWDMQDALITIDELDNAPPVVGGIESQSVTAS